MRPAHTFKFEITDPPRTWNKAEYKSVARYARILRNEIEPKVQSAMEHCLTELMVFGSAVVDMEDV